jgi:hypothetical protein
MANTRIVLNRAGVKALLRSPEVVADLKRRAEAIAAVAGEGNEVEVAVGPTRARAAVVTKTFDAMRDEATDRSLTRAIDAGRR